MQTLPPTDDLALPAASPELFSEPTDGLLIDAEGLTEMAREAVVRRGLAYFKENRVLDLTFEVGERLWAQVEGSRRRQPYAVEIWLDEDSEMNVECDCPYDWEPACKHAVAALVAYASRQPVPGAALASAADEAAEQRRQHGRQEVSVTLVDGDRWCGTWRARSVGQGAGGPYLVELRAAGSRFNACTCRDYLTNRLGTCKHIAAVEHRLRQRAPRKYERQLAAGPGRPLVHVDWRGPSAPILRLVVPPGQTHPESTETWFCPETGAFTGQLPQDRAVLRALEQASISVGADVRALVAHHAAADARTVRTDRIASRLGESAGHLPGLSATLYPYQVEGVAFLAGRGRALLADDMGLGKTLQAIGAALVLQQEEGVRRTLVVCPASLKHQWARELARFTGQEAVVVQGSRKARAAQYALGAPFTIVNYEVVMRDHEELQRRLAPDLLILDEAQRIKNWRTRTAGAVKSLDTRYAFVLTGTPLENRLEDLYSLLQVIDPQVLGPLWSFLLEFHVLDPSGRVLGYRNLSELRRRLSPVMLRRDRRIVSEQLPPRIDHRLDVALDGRQRNLHDEALAAASRLAAIMQRRPLSPSEHHRLMAALQKARMACNAAGLVDGETVGSPKLAELRELLQTLCVDGDHKVVIFTTWERMTRMVAAVAEDLGLGTLRLHGGVDSRKRGPLIDRFHDDPLARVFVSTDAGSTGLNLQCATALINLELPWNPAVLDQRIARIHRLGQTAQVQVFMMVALESYEGRIASLVASKRLLFDNVVDPDGSEDAVGLSRKALDVTAELLGVASIPSEPETPAPPPAAVPLPEPAHGTVQPPKPPSEDLSPLLAALEGLLPGRIERILARGGALVVVLSSIEDDDEGRVKDLSDTVQVALVDQRSWAGLCLLDPSLRSAPVAGA